jgi:alkylated DNA repair protein alkB family protein 6
MNGEPPPPPPPLPPGVVLPPTLAAARIAALPPAAYYIPNFISEAEEAAILAKVSSAPKPRWKQLAHRRLQTWPSDLVRDALLDAPLPAWLEDPVVARLLSVPLGEAARAGGRDAAGDAAGDAPTGDASTTHDAATDDGADDTDEAAAAPAHIFADSPHGRPNHVLVNEYPPGVGIMPHKDGAAYHPVVCTVSLGGSLCLNIHRCKPDGALDPVPAWRILQEPRSLLITTDELYTDYLHGIDDIGEDVDLGPETVANWDLLGSHDDFAAGQNSRTLRTSLTYRDVLKVSKMGAKLGMLLTKK